MTSKQFEILRLFVFSFLIAGGGCAVLYELGGLLALFIGFVMSISGYLEGQLVCVFREREE